MRFLHFLLAVILTGCSAAAQSGDGPARRHAEGRRQTPAWQRCEAPTDCHVLPRTCCGQCGAAVPGDAVAVSSRRLQGRRVGDEPQCEGGTEGCLDCYQETAPTLVATCRERRCQVVDLTRTAHTACRTDADCLLTFASCCACDRPGQIALRRERESDYRRLICGATPTDCPECAGRPLFGEARCEAGRCAITDSNP